MMPQHENYSRIIPNCFGSHAKPEPISFLVVVLPVLPVIKDNGSYVRASVCVRVRVLYNTSTKKLTSQIPHLKHSESEYVQDP